MMVLDNISDISELCSLCTICLSKTSNCTDIDNFLFDDQKYIKIKTIIERIMLPQVQLIQYNPRMICVACLSNLKVSLKLQQQFEKSLELIQNWLEEKGLYFRKIQDQNENKPPVEIIKGNRKINLKDILIVEDNTDSDDDYSSFLNNLGKSVNVEFANRVNRPEAGLQLNDCLDEFILKNGTPVSLLKPKFSDIDKYIIVNKRLSNPRDISKNIVEIDQNISQISEKIPVNSVQPKEKLKCKTCNKAYRTEFSYSKHIKECCDLPIHACSFCSKKFREVSRLNYHIKESHTKSRFPCKICKEEFVTRGQYAYHKQIKHMGRTNVCDICGKLLTSLSSLKQHKRLHVERDTTQSVCPICGKTFHYKNALFYHIKIHRKERNYICKHCNRRFLTNSAKSRHELTHTGERPYPCKLCNKGFFSSYERKKHGYIHTGYRPIKCDYCEKKFSSNFNYKLHLFSHDGPYSCRHCNRGFVTQQVLKFHYIKKHKDCEDLD